MIAHGKRAEWVEDMITGAGLPMHCLKLTALGHPSHPLYLPRSCTPQPYNAVAELRAAESPQ